MKTDNLGLYYHGNKILFHHLGSCPRIEEDNKDDRRTMFAMIRKFQALQQADGSCTLIDGTAHPDRRRCSVSLCVCAYTHTARRKRDCRCTHTLHGGREIVDIIMKNALPRDTGSGPPGHNYVNCTSFYSTSSSNRLTRMNDSLPLNLFPASWVVATTTPTTSTTHR